MSVDVAYDLRWKRWLDDHGVEVGRLYKQDIVPLGTGGVFAEAVLGRSNCRREARHHALLGLAGLADPAAADRDRGDPDGLARDRRGHLARVSSRTPIVNITSPTSLPDPVGTAAILQAIQNGSMFRDMSGLQATIGLVQAGIEQTMAGASAAGQQAGENMNNLLKATTERQRIGAEMVSSLAQTAASAYTGGADPGRRRHVRRWRRGRPRRSRAPKINYFDKTAESACAGRRGGRRGEPRVAAALLRSARPGGASGGGQPADSADDLLAEPRGARVRLGQQQVAFGNGRERSSTRWA